MKQRKLFLWKSNNLKVKIFVTLNKKITAVHINLKIFLNKVFFVLLLVQKSITFCDKEKKIICLVEDERVVNDTNLVSSLIYSEKILYFKLKT